jgi:hypothetical protein
LCAYLKGLPADHTLTILVRQRIGLDETEDPRSDFWDQIEKARDPLRHICAIGTKGQRGAPERAS